MIKALTTRECSRQYTEYSQMVVDRTKLIQIRAKPINREFSDNTRAVNSMRINIFTQEDTHLWLEDKIY